MKIPDFVRSILQKNIFIGCRLTQSPQKFQSCLKMTSKVPTLFNKSQYCVKIFWPLCNNFIFQILNSSHDEIQSVRTGGGKMALVLNNLKLHLRKGNYGPDRLYRL